MIKAGERLCPCPSIHCRHQQLSTRAGFQYLNFKYVQRVLRLPSTECRHQLNLFRFGMGGTLVLPQIAANTGFQYLNFNCDGARLLLQRMPPVAKYQNPWIRYSLPTAAATASFIKYIGIELAHFFMLVFIMVFAGVIILDCGIIPWYGVNLWYVVSLWLCVLLYFLYFSLSLAHRHHSQDCWRGYADR